MRVITVYVCVCNKVTDKQIRQAVDAGADSLEALSQELAVATCCGRCRECALQVMTDAKRAAWVGAEPALAL